MPRGYRTRPAGQQADSEPPQVRIDSPSLMVRLRAVPVEYDDPFAGEPYEPTRRARLLDRPVRNSGAVVHWCRKRDSNPRPRNYQ